MLFKANKRMVNKISMPTSDNATYKCERCGYSTGHKQCIIRHLERTNVCSPVLSDRSRETLLETFKKDKKDARFECPHCNKKFNHSSNLSAHKRICKARTSFEEQIMNDMNTVKEFMANVKAGTVGIPSSPMGATNNTVNTNTTNNNNTTNDNRITNNIQQNNVINVNIRNFDSENMEALPKQLLETLFLELKFRELIENLHCDPDFPENHNVRIKSIKRNVMEIYRNNKWDVVTFVNGLNELLLQAQRIFRDYYRKNRDKILEEDMDERDLRDIIMQLDSIEKLNEEDIRPIRKDIEALLESHRAASQQPLINN